MLGNKNVQNNTVTVNDHYMCKYTANFCWLRKSNWNIWSSTGAAKRNIVRNEGFLKKVLYDNSKEKDGFLVVYSNVATSDYKDYVTKVVMDTGNIVAVADSNKNRYKGTAVSNNILSSTINPKRWQCLIKFQVSVITYTF